MEKGEFSKYKPVSATKKQFTCVMQQFFLVCSYENAPHLNEEWDNTIFLSDFSNYHLAFGGRKEISKYISLGLYIFAVPFRLWFLLASTT